MRPFRKKTPVQTPTASANELAAIVFTEHDGDPVAELVEDAMRARDWTTVKEVFSRPLTSRERSGYLRYVADIEGLETWIDDIVRAEPESTLPLLVKGKRAIFWAWEIRGGGSASSVPAEAWPIFRKRLKLAENCFDDVLARDPRDIDALANLVTLAGARSLGIEEVRERFANASAVDPFHLDAHTTMLQQVCRKWSGSSAEMFEFARSRAALGSGTALPVLIALAHLEEWLDNEDDGTYMERPEVGDELVAAAHQSIWHPDYRPVGGVAADVNAFAYAFGLADRFTEAQRCFDTIGEDRITRRPWSYGGRPANIFCNIRSYVADNVNK
jgi:hypothetical protein